MAAVAGAAAAAAAAPRQPRRRAAASVAFGRKIAAVAKLSASEAREKKQIVGVRNKLLRSFEVERQRITSNDAVGANTARAALRDCATTADLRQALNFVEDQGALSGLALLQMKLAYMDSPGWLEAQMASDNRKLKRAPRPAEHERRQVKKVRAGLQTRGRRQVEQITQALVAVLRKNLGHVPLPECLRRWGRFVRATKAERVRSERTWRQTDAIMEKRAARMDSWRSRAHIVMRDTQASPDTGPAADAAAAAGEGKPEAQPTFGIGNNAEGAGAVERPQLGTGDLAGMAAGFPSTELQLQLIACRHAPEGTRRRTLAAQLQRDAHAELLRRCGRTPDEAVRDTSTWLEQNGVPARGAGGEPLTFAAGNPAVVSAPHPPALTRAAAAQQTPVVHADEDKREMQKVADVISAVVKQARTGRPDILVVLDRPLREIDEAIVKLAVGEAAVGVDGGSPRGVGGRGGALRWRPQSQKKPSMICNLGLRFDNQCEELLEVIDGSAAAAAARTQEQLRPGIFLTHVQGTVLQWAAVHDDAATAAAGCAGGGTREQPRAAQVNRLLTSALESGESLRFGFTAQPLHVYRVLHNGTVAAAATAAAEVAAATASGPRPTPPGSPTSGHRPPLSARAASRPTSATVSASASAAKGAARRPASAAPGYRTTTRPGSARPAAAAEAAGTRPLGSIARRQRPASARPDFGRASIGGSSGATDGADDDDAGTLVEQSPPQPGTNAKGDELVSGVTGTNRLLQKKRPPSAPAAAVAAGEESEKEEEGDAPADDGPAGTTDTVGGAAVHRRLRERPSTAPAAACTPRAGRSGSKAALQVLGTVVGDRVGGDAWSYADYASASANSAGPPGTVDTQELIAASSSSSQQQKQQGQQQGQGQQAAGPSQSSGVDAHQMQAWKQRERQWNTGQLLWRERGSDLRTNAVAATAAAPRPSSARPSLRGRDVTATKGGGGGELFSGAAFSRDASRWQAPTAARRGSESGAIVAWSAGR